MVNSYMEILVLLSLTIVQSERCPLGSFDEMQVFPPPPEFPDFMSAFEGTILRIGITNLLQNDGLTLSKTCPESVNWSEFNARLCGNDPFDLEGFCNPIRTVGATVASLTTPQSAKVRSISIETTTGHLVEIPLINPGINTTPSTTMRSPGLIDENKTVLSTPKTYQYPGYKDSEDHGLKDNSFKNHDPEDHIISKEPDLENHGTKKLGSNDSIVPPDVYPQYPVNGTTGLAEALYQGSGASIAIGVGCGLTLLVIVIIIVIIAISHTRGRGCRRLMNPLFKVFQRQTSDALPFNRSSPYQPSTPLEEIHTNGGILTDIKDVQLRWTEERRSTGLATNKVQNNLLTDFHQNKLEEDDGRTSTISSTSKTLKDKGQR